MQDELAFLQEKVAILEGRISALHALLAVFIGDGVLSRTENPEDGIKYLRQELFGVTKTLVSERPTPETNLTVASMESEFERLLGSLQNRVDPELRRRRGEPEGKKIPSVLFGASETENPN